MKNKNNITFVALLTFIFWFMGTRYYVGCDFLGYLSRFNHVASIQNPTDLLSLHEPGFWLLNWIVNFFTLDYMWLILFSSLFFLFSIYHFAKIYPEPILILALLFPVMIVQLGMSGLRQAIAIGFIMLSVQYALSGKNWFAAGLVLAASQFHISAVIFLPIPFLINQENLSINKLLGFSIILLPGISYILAGRVEVYQNRYIDQIYGQVQSNGAFFRYILLLFPLILYLRYKKITFKNFKHLIGLIKINTVLTLSLIPIAFISSLALHRLIFYIMPISIISFLALSKSSLPNPQSKIFPVLIYGMYILVWFSLSSHAEKCYIPYQSYTF